MKRGFENGKKGGVKHLAKILTFHEMKPFSVRILN
jgi:hypothetical protein